MDLKYSPYFQGTLDWVIEEVPSKYEINGLKMFEQFIPGLGYPNIEMFLFIRKKNFEDLVPYCTFVLYVKNYIYQIILPVAGPDMGFGNFRYVMFPSNYASVYPNGTIETELKDFSGTFKVNREEVKFAFSYGEAMPINKNTNK